MMKQFVYDLLQVLLNVTFATLLHVNEQIVNNILHSLFVVPREVYIVHRYFVVILDLLVDYKNGKLNFFNEISINKCNNLKLYRLTYA